jgi:hypothetical protein
MYKPHLDARKPPTAMHVLMKVILLRPPITGCGGNENAGRQEPSAPPTHVIPHRDQVTPNGKNNAFAPFSADERKKLHPLQVK